ncbi:very short patch repair endonuclease [Azospirillum sp.]|uniref:very short patch repair endonuclease n=1 Tax=Azospirillum sp. TaxID=34012 RepID=UPI002629F0B7|nr:very short patch repair endonuclease [Azospirillum sp.]
MMETTPKIDPERSRVMRAVKSVDTTPEKVIRRTLWAAGLRYRLHDKRLPGTPDVLFPSRKIALFVHGCFWHGHEGCPRHRVPKTRREYWEAKIARNRQRDANARAALEAMGWTVLVVWECETKKADQRAALVATIKDTARQNTARRR